MKNINWKKYAGAAMAAAMIPAAVAPIATEAAGIYGLHNGWNIKVTLDGKPANNLFAEKGIYLVGKADEKVYKQQNGKIWVPGGQTYDIYDVTKTKKGQIKVYPNGGTTVATLKYSTVAVSAWDVPFENGSEAYYEVPNSNGMGARGIINGAYKLNVDGVQTKFERSMGTHAPATVIYDLTNKNMDSFTATVGVDALRPTGSVEFQVYVDDKLVKSSLQSHNTNAESIKIDLKNAKKLKLVVKGKTNSTNPNEHAMGIWGNATFHQR